MADLDVALRLRLINLMSGGAADAIADLNRVSAAAEKVNRMRAAGQPVPAALWVEAQKQAEAMKTSQQAMDAYFRSIDKKLAQIGQMQWAFFELRRMGDGLKKPIEDATDAAVEFEKRIQSIAKAGGVLGAQGRIGEQILAAAKAGNVSWQDIARGERQMVALGGGQYLDQIGPVRNRLAQLISASESKPEDLYNLLYHYMHLAKMSPEQALSAMQVNYLQGKKGALELKDLAELMPRMIPLGQEYMSNQQVSTDLVALLEVLRKQTGSASEAETRARHLMTTLSRPGEVKKIQDELGVDVYGVRARAKAEGRNELFAVLDAIADKFKAAGEDPKKLGAIGRDYYFRSGLTGYMKMRDEIKEYLPGADEARKTTEKDFAATADTAAAALQRLAIAADEARIRTGESQAGITKAVAGAETKGAEGLGWFAKNFPHLTAALATGENAAGSGLAALGAIGTSIAGLATGSLAVKWGLGKFYQWRTGGAAAEAAKGAGAEISPTTALVANAIGGLIRGALASLIYGAGKYGIDALGDKERGALYRSKFGDDKEAAARAEAAFQKWKNASIFSSDAWTAPQAEKAGEKTMSNYADALKASEGKAVAAVEAIVAKLKNMLEFTATPTIQPRLAPAQGAPSAAPEKHASVIDKSVHIGQAHFHGVKDLASLHRQLGARVASERNSALHDMDIGGMG